MAFIATPPMDLIFEFMTKDKDRLVRKCLGIKTTTIELKICLATSTEAFKKSYISFQEQIEKAVSDLREEGSEVRDVRIRYDRPSMTVFSDTTSCRADIDYIPKN